MLPNYLYRRPISRGAYVLHEHPNGATSWTEPSVLSVLSLQGVQRIRANQCMHGQESDVGNPIKKPTGFMSNSPHLLDALHKRCFGRRGLCSRPSGGMHQNCLGKVARRAAIFIDTMCEMILSGFSAQMKADRRMRGNEVGVNHVMLDGSDDLDDFYASKSIPQGGTMPGGAGDSVRVIASPRCGIKPGGVIGGPNDIHNLFLGMVNRHERYIDDITGQPLNPELCRIARKNELDYFHSKGVWSMRSVQEAWKLTGRPPISVRWVEVNKGDDDNPNYRSRVVACATRMAGQSAATTHCANLLPKAVVPAPQHQCDPSCWAVWSGSRPCV